MTTEHEVPNIGELLKSTRESQRLTLDKVSLKTKINIKTLQFIEKNEFDKLPSPAYTKGFVLSYASAVGLEKNAAIASLEMTYQRQLGKPFPSLNHTVNLPNPNVLEKKAAETPVPTKAITSGTTYNQEGNPQDIIGETEKRKNQTRMAVSASIFVILFLTVFGIYKLVTTAIENETKLVDEKASGPTFVPSSEITKTEPPTTPSNTQTVTSSTPTPTPAVESQAKESEKKTPDVAAPATPPVERKRIFPLIEFKKINKKLFEVVADAPENNDEKIISNDVKNKLNPEVENVYIRAMTGNTWLSYKIDKNPITSVIVEKDKDLLLQGKEVLIYLGNVAATKIFYNNKLITTPTPSGVKSLIFPEASHSKYVLPLFPKSTDNILYTAEDYQKRMKIEEEQFKSQNETEGVKKE